MEKVNYSIRPAAISDAQDIASLLKPFANRGLLLERTPESVQEFIANFIVAEFQQKLIGCVALRDFGDGLEEIRSLAVSEEFHGQGIGGALISAAISLAEKRKTNKLFALTLRPNLFIHMGFHVVDMSLFPGKVWADCSRCPKKDCCDETAVQMEL